MEDDLLKSPNQLWRESGTTLSFADWIEREKDQGKFLINKKVSDSLAQMKIDLGINKTSTTNKPADNTFIGLNKGLLIVFALVVIGAVAYNIYPKKK